ncbi:MAG TPA: BTAD domain-containing putative transcriptional regulator [Acidimicrobiia bacterium]
MEFNVLGPVTVVEGTEWLNVGGPKQRTVLAILIAEHGRSVSNDVIAEAVYGPEATPRNRRTVQTYVSTLRSIVGEVITKAGSGWSLNVDRFDVDALRFEDLYESGRNAAPETAAEVLREALAIWRGHPFADIEAHGRLDAEITRLTELRVSAQQARIEADLAVGRHNDLVGEIEALLAEHPYREAFRAQHMLALYRAGRQQEALRSYEAMRSLLVEELGVDPTQELQDLEQRILDQDESLVVSVRTSIQKRAVLVVDPGDPLELARLPASQRDEVLSRAADAVRFVAIEGSARPAGTANYVVLDTTEEAIAAAKTVNRRLEGDGVRIAVDFGDVEISESGVTGPPVSRAAVLVSVAHPGQVILSSDAQNQIISDGPGIGLRFESLGSHALPGIEDSVPIYQLLIGDPARTFPPLVTDRIPPPLPEGGRRSVPGYELREPIGVGSIGTLYRAYQPSVGREVMVEVIGRAEASDAGFIRGFEADAQRLALLDHPHINPLLDYWRDVEGAFLVYRYHRGGFLGTATPDVLAQVGSALAYAHSYGIVHGSLRPDRVILDETGNGHLLGFPVGAVAAQSSPDYPAYIAPETLAGDVATVATDVYALGMLAFEAQVGPLSGDEVLAPSSEVLARALAEEPGDRPRSVSELLAQLELSEGSAAAERFTETRNPYKGLAAFHESDAGDFFGRDAVIEELVEALRSGAFVAVVGPSGVGKSSVVKAGLIPALRSGIIDGSETWAVTDMLPGSHPFLELERALERVAVDLPVDLRARFAERDPNALADVTRALPEDARELVVVVDQFEELFTMTEQSDASAFLELLKTASEERHARFIVTLRADFLDRPFLFSEFGELLRSSMVGLRAPNASELDLTITRPAARVGVSVAPAVVDRLVAEAHNRPGALPLLQYALVELFEARTSDRIDVDDYHRVGGVSGSLARRAESIYENLPVDQMYAVKQVFLRLVTIVDDSAPTRRRVRLPDLDHLGAMHAIETFVRSRMLVLDNDPDTRSPTVEVAHEALLTHWPRLATWIEESREELALSRRLDEAIYDWEASGGSDAYLLSGGRLAQHQAWTSTASVVLTDTEKTYLERSTEKQVLAERKRRRRRSLITGGFAAAAIIAAILAGVGLQNADQAETNAQVARARELASASVANLERNPELATLLALQALNETPETDDPPVELVNAIWQVGSSNRLVDVIETGYDGDISLSADGTRLATTVGPQTLRVYDSETHEVVWEYTEDTVDHFVYPVVGPDGRTSVGIVDSKAAWSGPVEGEDELPNRVVILTLDGEVEATLEFPECTTVGMVDWSSDGRFLAVSDLETCIREGSAEWIEVFDTATWESAAFLPVDDTKGFGTFPRFDSNGRLYAMRAGGQIVVFEAGSYEIVEVSEASGFGDVSPDGSRMYGSFTLQAQEGRGGSFFSVLSFDAESGAIVDVLHTGVRLPAREFGVTAGEDHVIVVGGIATHVYDPLTGEERVRLPTGNVTTVGYDSERQLLYTSGSVLGPRVWNVGQSTVSVSPTGDLGDFTWVNADSFVIGEDVGVFAHLPPPGSGNGGQTGVFDLQTGQMTGSAPESSPRAALANGRILVEIVEDDAHAWAIHDPVIRETSRFFECENFDSERWLCLDPGFTVVASEDGTELLAYPFDRGGGLAGEVHSLDLVTGEILHTNPIREGQPVTTVLTESWEFGFPIASFSRSSPPVVRDRASGEVLWRSEMENVMGEEVSTDERWLLTWGADGEVQLVDTETWTARFTIDGFNHIRGAAFNGAGTLLAVSDVQSMRIIDIETGLIAQEVVLPGVSDIYFLDDENVVVGTSDGVFGTVSVATDDLVARTRASLRRSFTDQECDTYRIDPCPELEELKSGPAGS